MQLTDESSPPAPAPISLRGLRDDLAKATHRGDSYVLARPEELAAALRRLDRERASAERLEAAIHAVDRVAIRHRVTGTVVVGAVQWSALLAALAPLVEATEPHR
ncbi:MAG: hypothetical protein ACXWZS_05165 [Gemmatirosa sp.]